MKKKKGIILTKGGWLVERWRLIEGGKKGGVSTSAKKAKAARANGKKGGRPRKEK